MAVRLAPIEPGTQIGTPTDQTRFSACEAHRSDSVFLVPGLRRLLEVELGNAVELLFPSLTGDGLSVLRRFPWRSPRRQPQTSEDPARHDRIGDGGQNPHLPVTFLCNEAPGTGLVCVV
jgi:hypothetical protein